MRIFFRLAISLLLLVGSSHDVWAQDFHFSDFRRAPSFINPALTGDFLGTYRVNGIYRDQWRSFGDAQPFQTLLGSIDVNVKGDMLLDNDWLSVGTSFLSDQAGRSGYKSTITGLQIGYHLGLDKDYRRVLSAGINVGQRRVRIGDVYGLGNINEGGGRIPDTGLGVSQGATNGQGIGSDISFGVTYKASTKDGNLMRLGLSLNHLNSPDASVRLNQGTGGGPDTTSTIQRKLDGVASNFIVFGEGSTMMSDKLRLNPALLFMTAAGNTELQLQSTVDYLVNPKKQFALTGGLGVRAVPMDAAYVIVGFIKEDISVRLSYDITLSDLNALGGGNSFEISVGYIGRVYRDPKKDDVIFCPRL